MTSRLTIPSGSNGFGSSSSYYGSNHSSPSSTSSTMSMTMSVLQYLSRLTDISQMDLQSALDQMLSLLSCGNPISSLISSLSSSSTSSSSHNHGAAQKVYKLAYYRKQTKNHWARDDPAFVAVQILLLAVSSLAYCIAFRIDGIFINTLSFAFHSIVVNYLGVGLIMASIGRAVSNAHLLTVTSSNVASATGTPTATNTTGTNSSSSSSLHVRQTVEFMYAFDIHCNAFFPLFVMLYGVQFFFLPIVLGRNFMAFLISNVLYGIAFGWYFYVTHLGYRGEFTLSIESIHVFGSVFRMINTYFQFYYHYLTHTQHPALPFLSNTEIFLFPIAGVLFLFILNLVGYPFGFGWNASRIMAHLYFETWGFGYFARLSRSLWLYIYTSN